MDRTKYIDGLWREFEQFFTAAYNDKAGDSEERAALRDYTPNQTWHNELEALVEAEVKNERQHRRGAPANFKAPISAYTAAKLLIMNAAADGAQQEKMPSALLFITWRRTSAEANLLGYLIRRQVQVSWIAAVKTQDYAEIMNAERANV